MQCFKVLTLSEGGAKHLEGFVGHPFVGQGFVGHPRPTRGWPTNPFIINTIDAD